MTMVITVPALIFFFFSPLNGIKEEKEEQKDLGDRHSHSQCVMPCVRFIIVKSKIGTKDLSG